MRRTRPSVAGRWMLAGVFLFVFVPADRVHSQAISQVVFLPQTFYVGDMVEARVVVRTAETLDLVVPELLPSTEWITVHSVTIVQRTDGFEARIIFQPFFVGTRQLPTIGLGAMELTGVSAFVNSMIASDDLEHEPIRDQLLLPGTRLLVAIVLGALVAIPLAVVGAGKWFRRRLVSLFRRYREKKPYRRLVKNLRTLQAEMHELDGKRYYIRLLDEARVFFDNHFDVAIRAATTEELEERLAQAGAAPDTRRTLVEMFRFGDLVKFAQYTVTVEDRTRHLAELRALAQEAYRNRKRNKGTGAESDVGA
jgi:hypothetical protein